MEGGPVAPGAALHLVEAGLDAWFFDTELLLLVEHNGLCIHEVPVDWPQAENSCYQHKLVHHLAVARHLGP